MGLLEKIEKWAEISPEVLLLKKIDPYPSDTIRFVVVVSDHLSFIRNIDWIGKFGSVSKFKAQEISDNFHSMSVFYEHGSKATFAFLEHNNPNQSPENQLNIYIEKESKLKVGRFGSENLF
jgi:hypothetical protein